MCVYRACKCPSPSCSLLPHHTQVAHRHATTATPPAGHGHNDTQMHPQGDVKRRQTHTHTWAQLTCSVPVKFLSSWAEWPLMTRDNPKSDNKALNPRLSTRVSLSRTAMAPAPAYSKHNYGQAGGLHFMGLMLGLGNGQGNGLRIQHQTLHIQAACDSLLPGLTSPCTCGQVKEESGGRCHRSTRHQCMRSCGSVSLRLLQALWCNKQAH